MQCETDKATIDYEEHGEGRPILLLHGWTMDRHVEIFDYEKIFATRPGWRRIYPDLPGMGRSVAKAGLFRQDDVLDALLAFVDQVLPEPVCARRHVARRLPGARRRRPPPIQDRRPAAARALHLRRGCAAHPAAVPGPGADDA